MDAMCGMKEWKSKVDKGLLTTCTKNGSLGNNWSYELAVVLVPRR